MTNGAGDTVTTMTNSTLGSSNVGVPAGNIGAVVLNNLGGFDTLSIDTLMLPSGIAVDNDNVAAILRGNSGSVTDIKNKSRLETIPGTPFGLTMLHDNGPDKVNLIDSTFSGGGGGVVALLTSTDWATASTKSASPPRLPSPAWCWWAATMPTR